MRQETYSQDKRGLSVPVAIIIAGILIAGAVYFSSSKNSGTTSATNSGNQQKQTQQNGQPSAQAVDISNVKIDEHPFIGNPNAPVTVAYWSDYQCPFCRKTEEEVIPQLINDYIKTGKVKLVYKDFQFLGADSQTAGLAEHAVWEVAPDKFYQWHKAMYDNQDGENSGWGSKADILALTKSLGIDSTKVDQLMTSKANEYQQAMDADKSEGGSFGVSGTPSYIVGKQLVVGAQPYLVVKAAVDQALNNK